MKLKYLFILLFTSSFLCGLGQNLVPNPGFEDLIECPDNNTGMYLAHDWFAPTNASSDIFNACHPMSGGTICPLDTGNTYLDWWFWAVPTNVVGCQDPHSGSGYAGIMVYDIEEYREYIQVKLTQELSAGERYYVQVFLSNGDRMHYGTDAFHIAFIEDSIQYNFQTVIDFGVDLSNTPGNIITELDEWVQLDWEYIANGTEKYVVFGNFYNNENTLLDSINPDEDYFNRAYYYIDDVYIGTENPNIIVENESSFDINIFPNPVSNVLQLEYAFDEEDWKIDIVNVLGQVIMVNISLQEQIDVSHLSSGYYVLRISNEHELQQTISFIKQ